MDVNDLQSYLDTRLAEVGLAARGLRYTTSTGGTLTPNPLLDSTNMASTGDPGSQLNFGESVYSYLVFIPADTLQRSLTATSTTIDQVLSVGSRWELNTGRFGDPWIPVRVASEADYGEVGYNVRFEALGIDED